jgi:glycerophosphoryl diester phosphodiesterase
MDTPLVIAHRGASGYRPENTLEAFDLAIQQGAKAIEFDLVCTMDQQLILRHENTLAGTTDIAEFAEFSSRKRLGEVESSAVFDFFTEDFTLNEIQQLRAIERLPELRPGSAKFDGQFRVPTFKEVLDSEYLAGKRLVVELKSGSHTKHLDQSMGELVAEELDSSNFKEKGIELTVESFDFEILMNAQQAFNSKGIVADYFFLLEAGNFQDILPLTEVIHGISISMEMLFSDVDWVSFAHQNGLKIWVYTARAEDAQTSIEAYYEEIIQTGVDGIFADQPDLLRRVIADRSGSAYDY